MDVMTESEPTLSSACCIGPDPYRPIGKFRVIRIIKNRKCNVPVKAGLGVSYIERRSVSNPGSHYRESSALPTELQDGLNDRRHIILY